MSYYKDRTGEKHFSNQGYEVEIIKYFSATNCTIRFNDERNTIREKVAVKEILSGSVKNSYHPETLGVGYMGVGKYTSRIDGKMTKCYTCWNNMLRRSCSIKYKQKHPTYKEVTLCKEWHNFQNFAKWYENTYPHHIKNIKFQLDKDLLQQGAENKIYSSETCVWLPPIINTFLSNKNSKNTSKYTGVCFEKNSIYIHNFSFIFICLKT